MKLLNTPSSHGLVSLALHWLVVLGIIGQWILAEAEIIPLHQSIGMVLLALACLRLAWRVWSARPAWPPDIKPHEIVLARIVHLALYALLFALPLSGWLLASVEDEPLRFFGWFDLPRIVVGSEEALEDLHEGLFNVLVGISVLHVLGAAKHWLAGKGPMSVGG
jgi:cytochrome b561